MSILINILLVIHVLVSLLIILLVLMQRPKNEGLGAAFGGGMTDNLFGAQTTNVLQSGTRWLGGIFFCLTLLLSFLYVKNGSSKSSVQKSLSESAVPVATPAPILDGAVTTPPAKPEPVEGEQKKEGTPPASGTDKPEGAKPPEPAAPPVAPKENTAPPAPSDTKQPEPPK
jgi:preprotein translocase subunit SecG